MEKKVLVISDIHGRGDEFEMLIRRILKYKDQYKLILLGDYIGYGLKPVKVINLLKFVKENFDCMILKGNWEDMFYNYSINKDSTDVSTKSKVNCFIERGGEYSTRELLNNKPVLEYYLTLIEQMPTLHMETINEELYVFAHSGINFDKLSFISTSGWLNNLDDLTDKDLMWNFNFYKDIRRYVGLVKEIPFKIVAGHTPIPIITGCEFPEKAYNFMDKIIGVDFGASKSTGILGITNLSDPNLRCKLEKVVKYSRRAMW